MRDYRGSGGFTLRQRRRAPRGLVLLAIILVIAAAIGLSKLGGLLDDRGQSPDEKPAAHAVSGGTAIPLPIPGQTPPTTSDEAAAR
jgi:hypothetical protein